MSNKRKEYEDKTQDQQKLSCKTIKTRHESPEADKLYLDSFHLLSKTEKNAEQVKHAISMLEQAAALKHAGAQALLGHCCEIGDGIEQDLKRAVDLYTLSAEQDDPNGQCWLGCCFLSGVGVKKDEAKAMSLFTSAAKQGQPEAHWYLAEDLVLKEKHTEALPHYLVAAQGQVPIAQLVMGTCCKNGLYGHTKDLVAAHDWFKQAAHHGNVDAQYEYATCLEYGEGTQEDAAQATFWYQKAATHPTDKSAHAVYKWACCLLDGAHVKQDVKQAVTLLEDNVKADHACSMTVLARCLALGEGIAKDDKRMIELLTTASSQNCAHAMVPLAFLYRKGNSAVKRDLSKSADLFKQASEQGKALAMSKYAECLLLGMGVDKNIPAAIALLKQSAAKQEEEAAFLLGQCYMMGMGVDRDTKEAIKLFHMAFMRGHASAAFRLGECYENGLVRESDQDISAHDLFQFAAKRKEENQKSPLYLWWC